MWQKTGRKRERWKRWTKKEGIKQREWWMKLKGMNEILFFYIIHAWRHHRPFASLRSRNLFSIAARFACFRFYVFHVS
jgi:hypothetical protein